MKVRRIRVCGVLAETERQRCVLGRSKRASRKPCWSTMVATRSTSSMSWSTARSGLSTSDTGSLTVRPTRRLSGPRQPRLLVQRSRSRGHVRARRASGQGGEVGGAAPLPAKKVVRKQLAGGHRAAQSAAGAMAVWCAQQPTMHLSRAAHVRLLARLGTCRECSRGADAGVFERPCVPGIPCRAAALASGTCQRGALRRRCNFQRRCWCKQFHDWTRSPPTGHVGTFYNGVCNALPVLFRCGSARNCRTTNRLKCHARWTKKSSPTSSSSRLRRS